MIMTMVTVTSNSGAGYVASSSNHDMDSVMDSFNTPSPTVWLLKAAQSRTWINIL